MAAHHRAGAGKFAYCEALFRDIEKYKGAVTTEVNNPLERIVAFSDN